RPRNSDRRQRGIGSSGGANGSIGRRSLLIRGVIVLDTNVASAMMRREVDTKNRRWLDSPPPAPLPGTAIYIFQVRFGIGVLAKGRRRRQLRTISSRRSQRTFRVAFWIKQKLRQRCCFAPDEGSAAIPSRCAIP